MPRPPVHISLQIFRPGSEVPLPVEGLVLGGEIRAPEEISAFVLSATGIDAYVLHDGGIGVSNRSQATILMEERRGEEATHWEPFESELVHANARPWQRPGWFAETTRWLRQELAERELTPGPLRQVNTNDLSCVLRAETREGGVFLKATESAKEAAVTRELAELAPHLLPTVLAADTERRLLMTCDGGPLLASREEPDYWLQAVYALSELHRRPLSGFREAVLVHRLQELPGDFESLILDATRLRAWGLNAALIGRLQLLLPTLHATFEGVAESELGWVTIHGDAHPMNVLVGTSDVRLIDWAEVAIGSPILDIGWFCAWLAHPSRAHLPIRAKTPDIVAQLWDAYWQPLETLDRPSLREAMLVALAHRAVLFDKRYGEWHGTVPGWRPAATPYLLRQLVKTCSL